MTVTPPALLPPRRLPAAGLLLLLCAAASSSASAEQFNDFDRELMTQDGCTSGDFCSCPPEEETYDEGDLGDIYGDGVCTNPPPPPTVCPVGGYGGGSSSTTSPPPPQSSIGDMCGEGDYSGGRLLLLRGGGSSGFTKDDDDSAPAELFPPSDETLRDEYDLLAYEGHDGGRELGWGDWGDGDSWVWYFCGGGVDVPLTMTGWEPEIKALWMKRHAKAMLADICAGTASKKYGVGRWDSIWNLGVTWIGGFGLQMNAVFLRVVRKNGKCYKKYAVTVTFNDHFDCDPGGGNTYHVKHTWNFHAYCRTPCPTTTTTTAPPPASSTQPPASSTSITQSSSSTTQQPPQSSSSTPYHDTTYDPYYNINGGY